MPPWKCKKGCKTPRGTASWHTRKDQCPYERAPEASPVGSSSTGSPPPGPQPEGQTYEMPGGTQVTLAEKAKGSLLFKDRPAVPVSKPGSPETRAKPIENLDWVIPKEATARFWKVVFRFGESMLNIFNRYLGMPKLPDDIMRVNASDEILLGEMTQPMITKLAKSLGFKTVEKAVQWIDTLTGMSIFGVMIGNLILFYASEIPKAPKIIAWRAKSKANKEKTDQEKKAKDRATYLAELQKSGGKMDEFGNPVSTLKGGGVPGAA